MCDYQYRMAKQDELYEEAAATFGPALERLARGYEVDAEKRQDLLQACPLRPFLLQYLPRRSPLAVYVLTGSVVECDYENERTDTA